MTPNLETTNLILGIMAAVSVLEALVLIGLAVGGFMVYRRAMRTIEEIETRQIAPLREKVEAVLADVKHVTMKVSEQTERVDSAITGTIDRVDETAERVKHSVRDRVAWATGVVRGVRAVIMSVLSSESRHEPPQAAAGRV
jgi:hypothetical protein